MMKVHNAFRKADSLVEPAYYRPLKNFFSRRDLLTKILFYIQNDKILTKGEEHPHKEQSEGEWQMISFLSFFK